MTYSKYPVYYETTSYFFGKEKKCKTTYYTPSKGYMNTRPDDSVITAIIYSEPNTYWEYGMTNKNGIYKIVNRQDWINAK